MNHLASLLIAVALIGCNDDDDIFEDDDDVPTDRDFTLRIENVAPWTVLKASTQRTRTDTLEGPLGPTDAYEIRFTAAPGHLLHFATMLGESNDWFFAPGPEGIPLYSGNIPLSGDITRLVRLWDAGTELDQEPGVGDATGTQQPTRDFGEADADPNVREVPQNVRLADGRTFVRPQVNAMMRVTLTPGPDRGFVLRIENVSTATTLSTSQGAMPVTISPVAWNLSRNQATLFTPGKPARDNGLESLAESGSPDGLGSAGGFARGVATPLMPGVFLVHRDPAPLFAPGTPDYGLGLEALAEDGVPQPLASATGAGIFDTPVGGDLGRAMPGQAYEVTFHAAPGDHVTFATMFDMSNDWFFATVPEGIALFDGDVPRSCDVTSEVVLYDLGTEADQELDVGVDVGSQQPAPDTGSADRDTTVREVTIERYDEQEVLHLRVTLKPHL